MMRIHPPELLGALLLTVLLPSLEKLSAAPAATPASAPVPDGLYFEASDHFQSISEPLQFTYKAAEGDLPALRRGVTYLITDLAGNVMAKGTSSNVRMVNELGVFTLLAPGATKGWKEGWYDLAVTLNATPDTDPFHIKFDYLARPGATRVVYLLDSITPEGFAEWLNTDFASGIEPMRSFPPDGEPGLVVMSHWRPLAPGLAARLRGFVEKGGRVVMFGDNTAEVDALSPLRIDRAAPYDFKPVKINKINEVPALDGWRDQVVFRVNARVDEGAKDVKVLAETDDGQPFLAVRKVGKGAVYSVAAPLKPSLIYTQLMRSLITLPTAPEAAAPAPDADGFTLGASKSNVGRFGWINGDRMNEMGMMGDNSFRMWDVPEDMFRVEFPPYNGQPEARLACVEANWLAKHLAATGTGWGTRTDLYFGLGAPGVLYRNADAEKIRLTVPDSAMVGWPTADGSKVSKLMPGNKVIPEGMDRPWLLFWSGSESRAHEWPIMVSTNRKVLGIVRRDKDSFEITFEKPGLDVTVMPLAGIRHFPQDEVAAWNPLPAAIVKQADWWARAQLSRPVACEERYKVDAGVVQIRDRYTYLTLDNDFGLKPLQIAPVPPLMPIVAAKGLATLPDSVKETGVDTFCGPFQAASETDTVTYTIPAPDLSYVLATKATDPGLGNPLAHDLFERICEHAQLPKNVYLPVGFSVIEKAKDQIYPDRDLRAATFEKGTQEIRDHLFIDLHRNLGGTYGQIMFKPYLDGAPGYDDTRALVQAKIERNLLRDVGFFQYKTFLLYRTEPNAGVRYPMIFLGPVRFQRGYRIFHDMNETAAIVLYSADTYAETGGDTAFLKDNLPYLEANSAYLTSMNDWAWMSSMAVEWGMGNNIDMLNSELPAWGAMHRIRQKIGDQQGADFATYMAARASVSATARFFFADFYNGLHFPDMLSVKAPTHELAAMNQSESGKNGFLPYGLTNGYGEGWPSLWPNNMSKAYIIANLAGLDIYNHSKGICPELFAAYRPAPVQAVVKGYEGAFRQASREFNFPIYYTRLAAYDYIMGDHEDTRAELRKTLDNDQSSAEQMGAGTADWEISSMVLLLELLRAHPAP